MATPYLDEAERCSRVALLHEGRLLALDHAGRAARRRCRARCSRSSSPITDRAPDVLRAAARRGRRADVRRARCTCGWRRADARRRRRARGGAARRPASTPTSVRPRADVARGRVHRAASRATARTVMTARSHALGLSSLLVLLAAAAAPRAGAAPLRADARRRDRARPRDQPSAGRSAARAATRREAVVGQRARGGAAAASRRWPATRAPTTSTRSASAAGRPAPRHLSRHPRQLPHAARRCSGRSTPAAGVDALERAARSRGDAPSAQDRAAARADLHARDHARLLGAGHRARSACASSSESLDARRRAPARRAQPARRRPGPAERRAVASRRSSRASGCC